MKATGKPVVTTLTIPASGDLNGVSVKDCTLRLAKTGKLTKETFRSVFPWEVRGRKGSRGMRRGGDDLCLYVTFERIF